MEFQLSYFKSWKMMLWKCGTQHASKFEKLSSGHRTRKGQFSFQSQRKAKGDLILNAAVLLAILLSYYGVLYADPLFAIGVAGYLLYNSWDIACESADHLMDKELPDDEKQSILDIANAHKDVHGVHDIRTRQGGKIKFMQMHLELDDHLSLIRAHNVADDVEKALAERFDSEVDILIHLDPLSVVPKYQTKNKTDTSA